MRNVTVALALALLTALGVAGPAAAIQTSMAKVVIVVGATHGATAQYRANADAAYAEAIKHTPKVTKVYSPNATWSKVKAAAYNANIVIYFGHGNGWPSPYTYDPNYTTKDGMGLNADLNGDGKLSDYENKYYGEPYMAQLHLAPNAIVLLHNLCYASGNSEPGGAAPSVSVARQRIDNYSAGFIKGGARAVIADGHMGPGPYLNGLFTTSKSILDLWRSMPNYHNHEFSFSSSRTPGYVAYSDPDNATSSFYRSLVVKPGLTTTAVTNAVGDTGLDPAALAVPGRASVETPEAPLAATAAGIAGDEPLMTLPAGTRLKTIATAAAATATTPAVIQVEGLDDSSIAGYVSATDLKPRDSKAPVLIGIDSGLGRLSPNGDDRFDEVTVQGMFSETVAWTVDIKNGAGDVVDTTSGNGSSFSVPWDGLDDGVAVADGTYTWVARGLDAWQNGTASGTGTLVVDTSPVNVTAISPDGSTVSTFSPNGDGVSDTIATSVSVPEAGTLVVSVKNGGGTTVRSWTTASVAGANTATWDGKAANGSIVPDGDYTLFFAARDKVGNQGAALSRPVRSLGFLSAVKTSVKMFYPHDNDRFSTATILSFALARPASVTWTIRNSAGVTVATHLSEAALAAGTQTWTWRGKNDAGVLLPVGIYTSVVRANDGTFEAVGAVKVEMNAFGIVVNDTTPKRGQKITIVATSAETLSGSVRLYITQPGKTTWAVTMTKLDSRTYRAYVTLKTGGSAGTLSLKVYAHDYDGRTQATILKLPLS